MGVLATCKVLTLNNVEIRADNIRSGDVLQDGSVVLYVLVSAVTASELSSVRIEMHSQAPLVISKWHPILIENEHQAPIHCGGQYKDTTDVVMVYSFLTDTGRDIIVNNIPCVALDHGKDGDLLKHYFFGTGRVKRALMRLKPDELGRVVCPRFSRHAIEGFVTDMYY